MIVSASYRTDIPAFYGEWFMNRLQAGFCMTVNPYGGQVSRVDLTRDAVGGFVFWTRNIGPFWDRLAEVRRMGFPFVVSYTITGYPRALEASVVDPRRSIDLMKSLRDAYGPKAVVWRYDTIVFSSLTPADFHRRNFEVLARALEGATDEAIVSFAQIYKKTRRNMDAAARKFGFVWEDPVDDIKLALASDLVRIATGCGMRLSVCGQRQYLVPGLSMRGASMPIGSRSFPVGPSPRPRRATDRSAAVSPPGTSASTTPARTVVSTATPCRRPPSPGGGTDSTIRMGSSSSRRRGCRAGHRTRPIGALGRRGALPYGVAGRVLGRRGALPYGRVIGRIS